VHCLNRNPSPNPDPQPDPKPKPSPDQVREALEADTAERFDCVLCNLYPSGGEAACKWHSDPEHGSRWALPTSVVTVGEPRRPSFRPTHPLP